MAKSAKKKKKKAKKERELTERLRGLGLRKQSAKTIAHTITNVQGQLPDSARGGMAELVAKVDDLRGRVSGTGKRRDPYAPATEGDEKAAKKNKKTKRDKKTKQARKARKAEKARKAAGETVAPR